MMYSIEVSKQLDMLRLYVTSSLSLTKDSLSNDVFWLYACCRLQNILGFLVFPGISAQKSIKQKTRNKVGVDGHRLAETLFRLLLGDKKKRKKETGNAGLQSLRGRVDALFCSISM